MTDRKNKEGMIMLKKEKPVSGPAYIVRSSCLRGRLGRQ